MVRMRDVRHCTAVQTRPMFSEAEQLSVILKKARTGSNTRQSAERFPYRLQCVMAQVCRYQ